MDRAGVLDVMPLPEMEETCRRMEQSVRDLQLLLTELETERGLLLKERKRYQKKLARQGTDYQNVVMNINRPLGNDRPFAESVVIRSLGAQLVLQTLVAPQDYETSQEVAKFSQSMAHISTESVVEEKRPVTFKPRDQQTCSKVIRLTRSDLSVKWGLQWEKRAFALEQERWVDKIYLPSPAHSHNQQKNAPKIQKGMRLVTVNGKKLKVEMKEELAKSFDIDLLFEDITAPSNTSDERKLTYAQEMKELRQRMHQEAAINDANNNEDRRKTSYYDENNEKRRSCASGTSTEFYPHGYRRRRSGTCGGAHNGGIREEKIRLCVARYLQGLYYRLDFDHHNTMSSSSSSSSSHAVGLANDEGFSDALNGSKKTTQNKMNGRRTPTGKRGSSDDGPPGGSPWHHHDYGKPMPKTRRRMDFGHAMRAYREKVASMRKRKQNEDELSELDEGDDLDIPGEVPLEGVHVLKAHKNININNTPPPALFLEPLSEETSDEGGIPPDTSLGFPPPAVTVDDKSKLGSGSPPPLASISFLHPLDGGRMRPEFIAAENAPGAGGEGCKGQGGSGGQRTPEEEKRRLLRPPAPLSSPQVCLSVKRGNHSNANVQKIRHIRTSPPHGILLGEGRSNSWDVGEEEAAGSTKHTPHLRGPLLTPPHSTLLGGGLLSRSISLGAQSSASPSITPASSSQSRKHESYFMTAQDAAAAASAAADPASSSSKPASPASISVSPKPSTKSSAAASSPINGREDKTWRRDHSGEKKSDEVMDGEVVERGSASASGASSRALPSSPSTQGQSSRSVLSPPNSRYSSKKDIPMLTPSPAASHSSPEAASSHASSSGRREKLSENSNVVGAQRLITSKVNGHDSSLLSPRPAVASSSSAGASHHGSAIPRPSLPSPRGRTDSSLLPKAPQAFVESSLIPDDGRGRGGGGKRTDGMTRNTACPRYTAEIQLSDSTGLLQFYIDDDIENIVDVFLIDHNLRPGLIRNNLLSHLELLVLSDKRESKIDLVDLIY